MWPDTLRSINWWENAAVCLFVQLIEDDEEEGRAALQDSPSLCAIELDILFFLGRTGISSAGQCMQYYASSVARRTEWVKSLLK